MHNLPATLKHSFWIVLLILLAACGPALTPPTPSATHQASATPLPPIAAPTETLTPTPPPTDKPSPIASPSPAGTPEPTEPVVTVPGLRMAYIVDGNLFVQDSGGQPVQLTHTGLDSGPVLSDDGQKLVFLRAKHLDAQKKGVLLDLYSINADGSQERLLVNAGQLRALAQKYGQSSEVFSRLFVPSTHRLLFNTRQVDPNSRYIETGTNQDLLMVDTDSGQFWMFFLPGLPEQINRFALSPNGQQLAVQRIKGGQPTGQIDIIGLDAKIARPDIFGVMFPDDASRFSQGFLGFRWTSDGNRLIAVTGDSLDLPSMGRNFWQYSMANDSVVETHFDPPPVTNMFAISPDGNWVVYTYDSAVQSDEVRFGVYLGNLRTGVVRKLGGQDVYGKPDEYDWSPDNTHFYFSNDYSNGFIGDNRGNMEPSCNATSFIGWLDNQHYLCEHVLMGELGKKGLDWVVQIPNNFPHISEITFVLLKDPAQTGK